MSPRKRGIATHPFPSVEESPDDLDVRLRHSPTRSARRLRGLLPVEWKESSTTFPSRRVQTVSPATRPRHRSVPPPRLDVTDTNTLSEPSALNSSPRAVAMPLSKPHPWSNASTPSRPRAVTAGRASGMNVWTATSGSNCAGPDSESPSVHEASRFPARSPRSPPTSPAQYLATPPNRDGPYRDRTCDLEIKSLLLYQLS